MGGALWTFYFKIFRADSPAIFTSDAIQIKHIKSSITDIFCQTTCITQLQVWLSAWTLFGNMAFGRVKSAKEILLREVNYYLSVQRSNTALKLGTIWIDYFPIYYFYCSGYYRGVNSILQGQMRKALQQRWEFRGFVCNHNNHFVHFICIDRKSVVILKRDFFT